jgi:hypothetical protein
MIAANSPSSRKFHHDGQHGTRVAQGDPRGLYMYIQDGKQFQEVKAKNVKGLPRSGQQA